MGHISKEAGSVEIDAQTLGFFQRWSTYLRHFFYGCPKDQLAVAKRDFFTEKGEWIDYILCRCLGCARHHWIWDKKANEKRRGKLDLNSI